MCECECECEEVDTVKTTVTGCLSTAAVSASSDVRVGNVVVVRSVVRVVNWNNNNTATTKKQTKTSRLSRHIVVVVSLLVVNRG